ncbi:zinc finger BED domain-containing protein RICESLEEPER 1-like isoform X5 [Primulina tabacum]|uniref:zinc finger BED domain-containing protein RICESLEEPER 1-like isoform X5 n=1 Tax=Primulina tabacum TaxID=48773 RepID=UPI003F59B8D6
MHNFKYDQAKIREILSHMIVVHELPFSFTEYELFNLLMKNATPHYEKISRATTRKDCITSYEIEKRKLMAELKQVNRVSVTTALWRLNATYFMLSTALKFKDVFPRYQQRDPTYNYLPSDEDWEKVIVVCSFLEEFNEVTHIISGSEYPTSKLFLPELYNIKKLLKNTNVGEDSFMADMIKKMKTKFDKYWGDCNLLISIAAVLDPRNKMKLIEWCFPEIYSEVDAVEHIVTVRETLRNLYNEYVEAHKKNIGEKDVQSESKRKL